ncbi:MAG: hypothetical protein ACKVQA_17410 [Burkholderiales bacterium]
MRMLLAMLILHAAVPALAGRIYECLDKNGFQRFTNTEHEIKGCKALDISSPRPQAQGKTLAANSVEELAWLSAAREDSDQTSRLQAIEDWARGSREVLDTVTHALVDPDESVRARAQELAEQVWDAKAKAQAQAR